MKTLKLMSIAAVLTLSAGALPAEVNASETTIFPAADDSYLYAFYPYMFFEGDKVKGSRDVPFTDIDTLSLSFVLQTEFLYCPAVLEFYMEGQLIAELSAVPGSPEQIFEFMDIPVTMPVDDFTVNMTLYRQTPEMEGCGSIILVEDVSTITMDGTYDSGQSDADGDGYEAIHLGGLDCDDSDPDVNPGATEVCNGVDDNCDGEVDEDLTIRLYPDDDGDGYGVAVGAADVCPDAPNYTDTTGDCDDSDAAVNPGAEEVCNGIDDNCNLVIDEGGASTTYFEDLDGDGYGTLNNTVSDCGVPDGYAEEAGDCDDHDSGTYPGASEFCDGADNDCDLIVDNRDVDEDGYVAESCGGMDCDDSDASTYPGADEIPGDGVDQDCDDVIDEDNGGCSQSPSNGSVPYLGFLAIGAALFVRRRQD